MKTFKIIDLIPADKLDILRKYSQISEQEFPADRQEEDLGSDWISTIWRIDATAHWNLNEDEAHHRRKSSFFTSKKGERLLKYTITTPFEVVSIPILAPEDGLYEIEEENYSSGIGKSKFEEKIYEEQKYEWGHLSHRWVTKEKYLYTCESIRESFLKFLEILEKEFHVYRDLDEFAEYYYTKPQPTITEDKFEGTKTISWSCWDVPFPADVDLQIGGRHIWFYIEGNPSGIYLRTIWNDSWRKRSWMGAGDVFTLLFEDKQKLVLRAKSRPSELGYRNHSYEHNYYYFAFPLTQAQLDTLAGKLIIAYKVEFASKDAPLEVETDYYSALMFRQWIRHNIELFEQCGFKAEHKPQERLKDDEHPFVYLMRDDASGLHRIGLSNNPRYLERKQQQEGEKVKLNCWKRYPNLMIAEGVEDLLQRHFSTKRVRGEWFELDEQDIQIVRETLAAPHK